MRQGLRFVASWVISAAVLVLLSRVVPGIKVATFAAALLGTLVLSVLNDLLRPLLIRLTIAINVFTLGLFSLVINGTMLWLASEFTQGFAISTIFSGIFASLILTMPNPVMAKLVSLGSDDDYFERLIEQLGKRYENVTPLTEPGMLLLEIDGLAEPTLQRAIREGYMPTLARWLKSGTHRLAQWDTGLPSQTSAMQAGILHGNNVDIPAFRWYEKERQRLMVSNHPVDAHELISRVSDGKGVLHRHGVSVNNLATGDAEQIILTMSHLQDGANHITVDPRDFYSFFSSPYGYTRIIVFTLWEVAVELWEAWRQRRHHVEPRVHRGGSYPLVRALSCVAIRDLSVYFLIEDMFKGMPSAYTTFVGYDEVAHHSGPESADAMRVLRQIDKRFSQLEKAARKAPRPYRFVVLSDHGQTAGAPFRQRYGSTLEEFVKSLVAESVRIAPVLRDTEGRGRVGALLAELDRAHRRRLRAGSRLLRNTDFAPRSQGAANHTKSEDTEIVVCVSGNLALIYFAQQPGRLTYEQIKDQHPDLIAGLATHEGIGWVMVRSESRGPMVVGASGIHFLAEDRVEGDDPLAAFGPNDAEHLRRLDSFSNVGDIVVNSMYDPVTGQVAPFEEFAGSHGGLGGNQNLPFVLFPVEFPSPPPISGAHHLYPVLSQWIEDLQPLNSTEA
jgi:uncharacterized membrane protein YvlD (DUF360 family)